MCESFFNEFLLGLFDLHDGRGVDAEEILLGNINGTHFRIWKSYSH
jgi:hypothetical protein